MEIYKKNDILFYFLIVILLLCGCSGRYQKVYVNPDVNFGFIKKVAVLPFESLSQDKYAGQKVWNMFITSLLATNAIDVVELGDVQKALSSLGGADIMEAQQGGVWLQSPQVNTTNIGKEKAMALGQLLGVQAIIQGSVEVYEMKRMQSGSYPEVCLSMRMTDVKTGNIIWSVNHTERGGRVLPTIFGVGEDSLSKTTLSAVEKIVETLIYEVKD
ncbi:MAG: hypothetical protein ACMUIP_00845 [bacterium]